MADQETTQEISTSTDTTVTTTVAAVSAPTTMTLAEASRMEREVQLRGASNPDTLMPDGRTVAEARKEYMTQQAELVAQERAAAGIAPSEGREGDVKTSEQLVEVRATPEGATFATPVPDVMEELRVQDADTPATETGLGSETVGQQSPTQADLSGNLSADPDSEFPGVVETFDAPPPVEPSVVRRTTARNQSPVATTNEPVPPARQAE